VTKAQRRQLRAILELAGAPASASDGVSGAFVHESAARESARTSNERLEFLGDSIVGVAIAEYLYESYPDDREGVLARRKARLASDEALAETARRLEFSALLELGSGERASGGADRTSLLAASFEAFCAALALQCGMACARSFVRAQHIARTDYSEAAIHDPKTALQELTQQRFACVPEYRERGDGPAHEPRFTSTVSVKGEALGTGSGHSKKAAQQEAAAQALLKLKVDGETQKH